MIGGHCKTSQEFEDYIKLVRFRRALRYHLPESEKQLRKTPRAKRLARELVRLTRMPPRHIFLNSLELQKFIRRD